jgi:hypothetical protein
MSVLYIVPTPCDLLGTKNPPRRADRVFSAFLVAFWQAKAPGCLSQVMLLCLFLEHEWCTHQVCFLFLHYINRITEDEGGRNKQFWIP